MVWLQETNIKGPPGIRGGTWYSGDNFPQDAGIDPGILVVGDMYLKNVDPNGGSIWRWTGTLWVYTGADITGPPGPQGDPGPEGPPGPTDWNALTNKPATFPPTLPIAQSGVTNLVADLAAKAPLASPALTGNPTAPTPAAADNDTSIATTAFVQTALAPKALATALQRNYAVNGAMRIAQETGGADGGANNYFPVDQWAQYYVCAPASLVSGKSGGAIRTYSAGTAKPALAAGDIAILYQHFEGLRIADFLWGTPDAKPAVLAFTWRSSIAGTFCASIINDPATHSFVKAFNVAANAPMRIVIPIPAMPLGTWKTDNQIGLSLNFCLAAASNLNAPAEGWGAGNYRAVAGQLNGVGTVGNSFFLSNVGLYLDPDNTGLPPPWQMPDYDEELRTCQRYWTYYTSLIVDVAAVSQSILYPVVFRAAPAISGGGAGFTVLQGYPNSVQLYQTARNYQNIIFNARL